MVIYIKFFEEDTEPRQFTTALEAKGHISNEREEGQKMFVAVLPEPVDDLEKLTFTDFEKEDLAIKFIDKSVEEKKEEETEEGEEEEEEV